MKPVYPGMKVCLTDGGTGTVLDGLIDARTGEERYVVLSVDGSFGPKRVAPYSVAWHVEDRAHLALTSHEAAALPRFDPQAHGQEAGLHRRRHITTGT